MAIYRRICITKLRTTRWASTKRTWKRRCFRRRRRCVVEGLDTVRPVLSRTQLASGNNREGNQKKNESREIVLRLWDKGKWKRFLEIGDGLSIGIEDGDVWDVRQCRSIVWRQPTRDVNVRGFVGVDVIRQWRLASLSLVR